jgi:diaminopimelate epimerase
MRFTKMHGLGNDFICVECFEQSAENPPALVRAMTDRHFGVGGDGLILITPSEHADARMRIFNADGSEAEMSGNGLRCLVKYVYEHGLSEANPMSIETMAGVRVVELLVKGGHVVEATVDMGEPILDPARMGVETDRERIVDLCVETSRGKLSITCVSVGNPHAVIYVEDLSVAPLGEIGAELEVHSMFRDRVNVHLVQVVSEGEVLMGSWERGCGATLACGTGAAAVCVAGVITGRTERKMTAHLAGGDLDLEWRAEDNHVMMTGPAEEVFSGEWAQ